jgi:glucokinase
MEKTKKVNKIMHKYVIGVDLGGTSVKAGVITGEGGIRNRMAVPTKAGEGPPVIAEQIVSIIGEVSRDIPPDAIAGVGVATPGLVRPDGNTVEAPPNFSDWDSFPLRDAISRGLGNKFPVAIENDANTAALAEAKFGAGRGHPDFLFIIWGTGIGGGIILDGKIYHGPHGGAGEIGHSSIDYRGPTCNCGNIGCIESFLGQRYLSARAVEYLSDKKDSLVWDLVGGDESKIDPIVLEKAALDGDKAALAFMTEAGELLGVTIASFMNTMNFDLAIVGGGVSGAGDLVFEPMNDSVRRRVMAPLRRIARVLPAQLGNDAGIKGAGGLVM